jgi:hypothetical protein
MQRIKETNGIETLISTETEVDRPGRRAIVPVKWAGAGYRRKLRWALLAPAGVAAAYVAFGVEFHTSSAVEQKLAMDDSAKGNEAVGLDIRSKSTNDIPANGADIVNTGPGIGADVAVTGNGASSVTGVRVIQQGPGTGLRVIQQGPGIGLRVQVGN